MTTDAATPSADAPALDGATYDVLHTRLTGAAHTLAARAQRLNDRRLDAFGGTGLHLLDNAALRTERPATARALVHVAGHLLAGYQAAPAAGAGPTALGDVFRLHRPDTRPAAPDAVPGLLDDPAFQRDFAELHRYYRQARLLQLRRTGTLLLAVFQTGERADDLRVLRWRLDAPDDTPHYLDDQGERDHTPPPPHDVTWVPATRQDHVRGRHPHLSVADGTLFVSTVGGRLTVKLTDDTETPEGIHSEPVAEPLQSLADADVAHARVGPLVLLRVRPYKESTDRYLVFNERTGEIVRLDGIGLSCRRLPEDEGVIFPGGCYLATAPAGAAVRTFDTDTGGLAFEAAVPAPGGEDVLYVFHARAEGRTLLLPYNLIRKEVAAPITARGHALLDDGTLAVLRPRDGEPARLHPVQRWRTPFTSEAHAAARPPVEGPLGRVGNQELVRAVSDALSIARMADEMAPGSAVFTDIAAACARLSDSHPWLAEEGLEDLHEPLAELGATAARAIEEFERVEELRAHAAARVARAAEDVTALVRRARGEAPRDPADWVTLLTDLRRAQGAVALLHDLRHADTARVTELAAELTDTLEATGRRAVDFLARPHAFDATAAALADLTERAASIGTAAEAAPLEERVAEEGERLQTVSDVAAGLEIPDVTVRTGLLERVGEVMAAVNRARAVLDGRRRELREHEGRAEFTAEFALLGQAVAGALAAAGTPAQCDEQLAALLLRLENLEARFALFDDALAQLAERREEIYETFSARKQAQLDERARHAERLAESAARVLDTVVRRAGTLGSPEDVGAFFTTDPLVARVRASAAELRALEDTVRADTLEGRLTAARQEAARALRDRADLYDGEGTVRLGRHRFAVTTQPVDLTLVPQDGALVYAVTGTDYRAPVHDAEFARTRAFWDQPLPSESPEVYRAEHLAARVLAETAPTALRRAERTDGGLLALVWAAAESAYDEGYDRGVHDQDAAAVLAAVLRLRAAAGLLRFPPAARAAAQLLWAHGTDGPARAAWTVRAQSLARARAAFGTTAALAELATELTDAARRFVADTALPLSVDEATGTYLAEELALGGPRFATGAGARALLDGFRRALGGPHSAAAKEFAEDLHALGDDLAARHQLTHAWLHAYVTAQRERAGEPGPGGTAEPPPPGGTAGAARTSGASAPPGTAGAPEPAGEPAPSGPVEASGASGPSGPSASSASAEPPEPPEPRDLPEAVAVELCGDALDRREVAAPLTATVPGLLGTHPRLRGGALPLRLDEFLARTADFRTHRVPAHRAYTRRRNALLAAERERLRLDDFRPRVMSAFVRNRLIDEVYLPLVGDNLAKQLGTAGEERRTDSQGLLLLLSPPGYGKTTLVEYVAARLGLVLVTVNGPALGHHTTSLDPAAAPDAAARREVEKINFALEMGGNVCLYLDDIQHLSAELLQKFIPLCDAQRRIEGLSTADGRPRSHDLRGKRFAVVMSGNPFTESGARFTVPDMLGNRADVWNLGDVLSGREDLFALSHVENALTSHPVLAPLAARDRGDVELLVRLAAGDATATPDRLAHPYPPTEVEQITAVLRRLLHVRRTVLAVNAAYIASAGQDDATRTEPPFRLQGSYRNTNQLVERIVPVMNDAELEALLDDHYQAEAQTLTTGAEANLLKLAELRGRLTPGQERRWAELKARYGGRAVGGGAGADAGG
ncbi:DNA repair ATPase [Streptomyces sp. TRM70308]|uniref:DNA repair ATPase n=1 Tax=Streptomyces sp. TRM70308 TaxID=3131932 RepID=UPI003D052854